MLSSRRSRSVLLGGILATAAVLGLLPTSAGATPLPTAFTYQGQINQGGTPLTGTADFRFSLYDALSGGTQAGSTLSIGGVTVTGGIFAALLDFGVDVFNGDARYLEIEVRSPAGGGAYSTLSPRVTVTAAPYALQTRGIFVNDAGEVTIGEGVATLGHQDMAGVQMHVRALGNVPTGILGESTASSGEAAGIKGTVASNQGKGLVGEATSGTGLTQGVFGKSNSTIGEGVHGDGATGVFGETSIAGGKGIVGDASKASKGVGVQGLSADGEGVRGGGATGVFGETATVGGKGIVGDATKASKGVGVQGLSADGEGVRGDGLAGVSGSSDDVGGTGVIGVATGTGTAVGVDGSSTSSSGIGVRGVAPTGVSGSSTAPTGVGVKGAGWIGMEGTTTATNGRGLVGRAAILPGSFAQGVFGDGAHGIVGVSRSQGANFGVGMMGVTGDSIAGPWGGLSPELVTRFGVLGFGLDGGVGQVTYGIAGVVDANGAPDSLSAGVLAEGNRKYGTPGPLAPPPTALEVRRGVIAVSGPDSLRTAGSVTFLPPSISWQQIQTCPTEAPSEKTGYYADLTIRNKHIGLDSIILVTVRAGSPPGGYAYGSSIHSQAAPVGEVKVRVTVTGLSGGCSAPSTDLIVNYLIIDPRNY